MKRSHQALIFATSIVAGLGIGLYFVNKTELGSVIKGKLEQLNPISLPAGVKDERVGSFYSRQEQYCDRV